MIAYRHVGDGSSLRVQGLRQSPRQRVSGEKLTKGGRQKWLCLLCGGIWDRQPPSSIVMVDRPPCKAPPIEAGGQAPLKLAAKFGREGPDASDSAHSPTHFLRLITYHNYRFHAAEKGGSRRILPTSKAAAEEASACTEESTQEDSSRMRQSGLRAVRETFVSAQTPLLHGDPDDGFDP